MKEDLAMPGDSAKVKSARRLKHAARLAPEVLAEIRSAFEVFDEQSALLQKSFENLKQNLAEANRQLNEKNQALSDKVTELHAMSSRLSCILESLGDGVLVVGGNFVIERCNPAAADLLELRRDQIENQPYDAITSGLGNPVALRNAIAHGTVVLDEQRQVTGADGQKTEVLASVSPIRGTDGGILGAVEVLRDITQQRLLEERVQHQKRIAALGEMAASVAHEIRNPLGAIEGFARLLRSDLEKDGLEQHKRMASKIIAGVQNLNYVITNLLTYARPLALQSESVPLTVLLESVRELLAEMAGQRQVKLEIDPSRSEVRFTGDVRQLRQVLVNLGRNAIEACAKNGCVSIRAEVKNRTALFTVKDNGCGISKKDLPYIFDPFYTKKEAGTGLGLSLCHKIVSGHGGEIAVSSKLNEGTVFKVVIPQLAGGK